MKSLYTLLFSLFAIVCFGQTDLNEKLIDAELEKITKQYTLNDEQKELVRPLLVVKHEGLLVTEKKNLNAGSSSQKRLEINTDFYKSFNQIVTEEQKKAFLDAKAEQRRAKMSDQKAGKSRTKSPDSGINKNK